VVVGAYLREADHRLRAGAEDLRLGPDLELQGLRFHPQALPSGGATTAEVRLRATADTSVEGLCVLVFSQRDTRVAVIDLRAASGPYRLAAGQAVTISRYVRRLALVEGDYKVGLFVSSRDTLADFLDLGLFEVTPAELPPAVLPYPAVHRGFVELDCADPVVTFA
jgi:hypothetical protein